MYELEIDKIKNISKRLNHLLTNLNIDEKKTRVDELGKLTSSPDLWNDGDRARELLKEQQILKRLVNDSRTVSEQVSDFLDFAEIAAEEKDESLSEDIKKESLEIEKIYDKFEFKMTLNGELDPNNAYLTIHSGAGGTEACDWVQMLLRMYIRWGEAHEMKVEKIDFIDGEETGYKSVTIHISGEYAYGYLKAERGVHRLVRISPFDSNKRRHTSFASVDVTAEVNSNIEIEIDDKDLRTDTYRSSGAGGQHVNVTDSAVRITHLPTGIVAACQNERSQHKNRATAMKMLKAKLYQFELEKQEKEAAQNYADKQKIEWGSQIRSYVLHPYNLVKDVRTNIETSDTTKFLDGDIDKFIEAYLRQTAGSA
ncbi:MAG: peptide chain release factor 2 [Chlamydiae bacterium]|nr:MAG: peptide chain release factor 2 [Chlamydiota bacterium]